MRIHRLVLVMMLTTLLAGVLPEVGMRSVEDGTDTRLGL